MLSCLPHRPSDSNDYNEICGPDITDKTFEVSMINSGNINPQPIVQYGHQIKGNQYTKDELRLPGYDMVTEQTKDKELLKIKEELQSGKASQPINSQNFLLDNVLY